MDTQWMIETHGDPLGALRNFVRKLWQLSSLEGLLVPANGKLGDKIKPHLIQDPALLEQINPFKPLMTINAAKLIPGYLKEQANSNLGVLLRRCEMRALVEMAKRVDLDLNTLLTICVDCLGTFPASEFSWRAQRKGSSSHLTDEALQFARQGGIMAYRYRSACQLCVSPDAYGAEINIGVIGLPVRQHILILARDSDIAGRLQLGTITDGPASASLVNQRQALLGKLSERRSRTRERVIQAIADVLPSDVDALIDQLESCGDCQKCLDACPICMVDFPQKGQDNRYRVSDVMRWMVSCAGCGMCEQACPRHKPLSTIFSFIREQLAQEYGYTPGRSLEEPLPAI